LVDERGFDVAGIADVAIGLDFGTSSLKLVARDEGGTVLARIRRDYPTLRPEIGAAEQDPADWITACDEAMSELRQTVEPSRWAVLGLSAMLPTLVSLTADGETLWPALTWEDARADDEGEDLRAAFGEEALYRATGQRVDGRYLLPMHMRRSNAVDGVDCIASAKDYLFSWLTGHLITDPSTASGYGAWDLAGGWMPEVLERAGVPGVPPIAESTDTRALVAELADAWDCERGLPVMLGAADSVLGAYGLGVDTHGSIAYIAGTSNVILGWSSVPTPDALGRYIITPMAAGGFGLELDLLATGSAFAWLAALMGVSDGAAGLSRLAEGAELDDAPIVLPYFSPGEQGALWDSALIGAIEGLTLSSTREQVARGLFAGVICESKRCIDVLGEAFGDTELPILMTGSGGRPVLFRQDLADATGREIWFDADETDHSALGAALLAGRTVMGWPTPARTPRDGYEVTIPRPDRHEVWIERFAAHERARLAQEARR
jgi:sugar (pentulose or hexulose) kinase